MASPLAVRIGIVQSGTLVEERLLIAPRQITVGSTDGCTFVLPSPRMKSWRLLERHRGCYRLRLSAHMEARLSRGSAVEDVSAGHEVDLPEVTRGRVAMGDIAILFQLVVPPAVRPLPQLPVSLRRRFWREVDRPFAVIALLSFLLHAGFTEYLRRIDWPRGAAVEDLPDFPVHLVMRRIPLAPPSSSKPVVTGPRTPRAPRPLHKTIGLIAVLTSVGGQKALHDLLRTGRPDEDPALVLSQVTSVETASDQRPAHLMRDMGGGKISGTTELRNLGMHISVADVGPSVAERRVSVVRVDPPAPDEVAASGFDVTRQIRGHLAEIRACYERALKRRADITGKLVLRLTIAAAGTVTSVELDDDTLHDAEVSACVLSAARRWRFPPPPHGSAELSFPFVFQPSNG